MSRSTLTLDEAVFLSRILDHNLPDRKELILRIQKTRGAYSKFYYVPTRNGNRKVRVGGLKVDGLVLETKGMLVRKKTPNSSDTQFHYIIPEGTILAIDSTLANSKFPVVDSEEQERVSEIARAPIQIVPTEEIKISPEPAPAQCLSVEQAWLNLGKRLRISLTDEQVREVMIEILAAWEARVTKERERLELLTATISASIEECLGTDPGKGS